jgi:hypothetical protein
MAVTGSGFELLLHHIRKEGIIATMRVYIPRDSLCVSVPDLQLFSDTREVSKGGATMLQDSKGYRSG